MSQGRFHKRWVGPVYQHGMTLIGLLIVMLLVGIIGYAGISLMPVYLNYLKVARAMDAAAAEYKIETGDVGRVSKSIERHWEIEGITGITGINEKDIEIRKEDGALILHVAYDDLAPLILHVSLAVHFDKTVKVQ